MKYMKLGTKPDTFYTEDATRTVLSDVPTDLVIQINNTRYILHKFPLLLKSGLLQRLCSDSSPSSSSSSTTTIGSSNSIILTDFPGGESGFELCAKFCYNIYITLSAHNFLHAFSSATFLVMTESVSRPNLLPKLHTFFHSFILTNWKDSVITLTSSSPSFSDPSIIRPLIESIISKILTPPSKVTWSFTYSRQLAHQSSIPKDWWTEDVADLDLNHFRSIISAVRSTDTLPPALIGEALHVYTVKNLPDPNVAEVDLDSEKDRRVLESIVSMIPLETGAVSGGFLMRLLKISLLVGGSTSIKAELVRRAGRQLDEVSVWDLVFCRGGERERCLDIGVVEAVVERFLEGFRRRRMTETDERQRMGRAANVFDGYLGIVAREGELSIDKFAEMAELVPMAAREEHDGLYKAIDTFLEAHPDLSKAERKRLCQLIDCQKLSPQVRSQAIANDRLPLRILVQLLFVEQERIGGGTSGSRGTPAARHSSIEATTNARESHEQQAARRLRQEQAEQRYRQQQQQREETAEGARDEGVRIGSNAVVGNKGEGGSESKPRPKVRGETEAEKMKKMAKRPG